MSNDLVQILDGNTFVVSDERGDIEASLTDPTGLFSFDTRYLSKWVLTVNGQRLNPLSVDDLQYFQTRFFLVPGTGTVYSADQMGGSGLTVISDADIESAGGIAYTLEQEIAVAAVSVTTVSLPEVSVTVTGGRWADRPALDGPAAVAVAKELIGI